MYWHGVVAEVDLILSCSLSTAAATTCQGGAPQQSNVQLPKGKVLKLRSSTLCYWKIQFSVSCTCLYLYLYLPFQDQFRPSIFSSSNGRRSRRKLRGFTSCRTSHTNGVPLASFLISPLPGCKALRWSTEINQKSVVKQLWIFGWPIPQTTTLALGLDSLNCLKTASLVKSHLN